MNKRSAYSELVQILLEMESKNNDLKQLWDALEDAMVESYRSGWNNADWLHRRCPLIANLQETQETQEEPCVTSSK